MADVDLKELTGIYRSFSTINDITSEYISTKTSVNTDYVNKLLEILFPTSLTFHSGLSLWEKFTEIASDSEKKLSKLVRFYYFEPNQTNSSNAISSWYSEKGGRPSTYAYPSINKDPKNKNQPEYSTGSSLSEMMDPDVVEKFKSKVSMILVDTPAIDLKLRNADKVEIFANYFPSVMMSQTVPYLDVKFITQKDVITNPNSKIIEKDGKQILLTGGFDFLSPIGFLKGKGIFTGISNDLMYSAYSTYYDKHGSVPTRPPSTSNNDPPSVGKNSLMQQVSTGIEMFTMPQTLINMDDVDKVNPRYNPILNLTVPFGAIQSVSINAVPSYSVFSFKTAALTMKIFDRSRLNEIAEILNPILYSKTTVLLTYGWRAPAQPHNVQLQNKYHNFINGTMMKSETYGIRNSSISIDNSGVVNVTLDLFTKGTAELRDVTPTSGTENYNTQQNELLQRFEDIKRLAEKLNIVSIKSAGEDIRGSMLLGAALGGGFPQMSEYDAFSDFNKLQNSLRLQSNEKTKKDSEKLIKLIKDLYITTADLRPNNGQLTQKQFNAGGDQNQVKTYFQGKATNTVYKQQQEIQNAAKKIIKSRFESLKKNKIDFFSYIPKLDKQQKDSQEVKIANHPLLNLTDNIVKELANAKGDVNSFLGSIKSDYGDFGNLSFGKVLLTYITSACQNIDPNAIAEEYQLFFYNMNENAGLVANLNIAEFPIEMSRLEDAYTKRVVEQRGENMTLLNFLEIVRESQFSDIRHPAFGFADLYEKKQGTEDLILKEKWGAQTLDSNFILTTRVANANKGTGEPFCQPTIDFYVESGYSQSDSNQNIEDLLVGFDKVSNEKIFRKSQPEKIIRIHIYDKAASPHQLATSMLKSQKGFIRKTGKYKQTQPVNPPNPPAKPLSKEQQQQKTEAEASALQKKNQEISQITESAKNGDLSLLNSRNEATGEPVRYENISFRDANGNPRFDLLKKEISRFVPTLIVGSEGSMITNLSYSTNQDSALSTIMMLRSKNQSQGSDTPGTPGIGDLPMRVIPGQLTVSMLGCPLVEYMQQFFVDLGTGTSIDNLYNVVGITHNISPGKFTTELKMGFYDAYGKYEGASSIVNEMEAVFGAISDASKTK